MTENKKEPFIEPVNHSGNGTRGSRTTLSLIIIYHIFGKNARKKYGINDLAKETPLFRGVFLLADKASGKEQITWSHC